MSLLFNMLSRFVIAFLPRNKCLTFMAAFTVYRDFGAQENKILDSKASTYNAGHMRSIPGSGRSPGEENGNPLQYSCLEIPQTEEPGRLQSMGLQKVRCN